MVAPIGLIELTYGNLGINILGVKDEGATGIEINAVGASGRYISRAGSRDTGTETGDAQVGK